MLFLELENVWNINFVVSWYNFFSIGNYIFHKKFLLFEDEVIEHPGNHLFDNCG